MSAVEQGPGEDPPKGSAESASQSSPNGLRKRAIGQLLGRHSGRLFLQGGLPWGMALLVGLVSVLYAQWSTDVSNAFLGWIKGRPWLAFVLTPALTVLALFLTRRWFTGSEGSGIPQVIAALHALRAEEEHTLIRRLFGVRVIVGKIGVSLIGLLGGLTIGREGPTVHIGAAMMAEIRRFYPRRSAQLERRLLLAGAAAGLSAAFNTPSRHHLRHRGAGAGFREPHQRCHDHGRRILRFDFARARRQLPVLRPDERAGESRRGLRPSGLVVGGAMWALRCDVQSGIAAVANVDAGLAHHPAGTQASDLCPRDRNRGGCTRCRFAWG